MAAPGRKQTLSGLMALSCPDRRSLSPWLGRPKFEGGNVAVTAVWSALARRLGTRPPQVATLYAHCPPQTPPDATPGAAISGDRELRTTAVLHQAKSTN